QSGRRIDNRVVEVSEMTRATKIMAKELNVPVILISQLSRGTEQRGAKNRRPMLSDLRESGSIEQDADVVLFLYREDYYEKLAETGNQAECIIEKNRHGPTSTIMLHYQRASTKFVSAAFEGPPPEQ
ncbi:MAG TPA: DnaB-like helicase C-terminal domain-containing protein, partial [Clostridiales bacterium]|nr:DnaB-like helicase C-terminal domain-containing protein [Clostridiales bacterium]